MNFGECLNEFLVAAQVKLNSCNFSNEKLAAAALLNSAAQMNFCRFPK